MKIRMDLCIRLIPLAARKIIALRDKKTRTKNIWKLHQYSKGVSMRTVGLRRMEESDMRNVCVMKVGNLNVRMEE